MEPALEYHGSRKKDNRYGTSDLMSGLVELAPGSASAMSQQHFAELLRSVGGVKSVVPNSLGTAWCVVSELTPNHHFVFELTRHTQHTRNALKPDTVTAFFWPESQAASVLDAWRILRKVVRGKELLPQWVDEWHRYICQLVQSSALHDGTAGAPTEPSSASSLPTAAPETLRPGSALARLPGNSKTAWKKALFADNGELVVVLSNGQRQHFQLRKLTAG